jgi:hypothetical protein
MLSRSRRLTAHRRSLLGIPFAPGTGALVTCGLPVISACGKRSSLRRQDGRADDRLGVTAKAGRRILLGKSWQI